MAEVLAAFSAVASFFQLVDFTAKVISATTELLNTGADALRENVDTAHLTREYEVLADDVASTSLGVPDHISRIANECRQCARKLIADLDQLRLDVRGSKARRVVQGTQMVVRTMRRRKDIEKARRTLQELNGLLSTAILKDIWVQNQSLAAAHMTNPHLSNVGNVHQVRMILARKKIGDLLDSL